MASKHLHKYLQKYYLFFILAILLSILHSCSTRKVPEGAYLLTQNKYVYQDGKLFADRIPDYVIQKPNSKTLFLLPFGLWMYNMSDPKLDDMLNEYNTYPSDMRTRELRDSLAIKYKHPEVVGKNLFWNRFLHNVGQPPVILDQASTEESAEKIRKFLVYKGYWRAKVEGENKLKPKAKKATAVYKIKHNNPTYISDFYYNIPEKPIRRLFEREITKTKIKEGNILDQEVLEEEVKRITDLMRNNGYFQFNKSNEEIFFTADTLQGSVQVPITLEFKRDEGEDPYVVSKFDEVRVMLSDTPVNADAIPPAEFDTLRRIQFYNPKNDYKNKALWNAVIVRKGDRYNEQELNLTKRNLAAMNNFTSRVAVTQKDDSLLVTDIYLTPLPKYEFRIATDVHYSEILNFGFSPSLELTTRNIFGGAENLNMSFSGIVGTTNNARNPGKIFNAYELSTRFSLQIPKLLLPFKYYKVVPKRYSPRTAISLGASIQNNIGLGRISFNGGLTYNINVNDVVSHSLSLINMQLNFTQNKNKYYELFPADNDYRQLMFQQYFQSNPLVEQQYRAGLLANEDISRIILADTAYQASIDAENDPVFINFQQSQLNKERQTQDVIINSLIYNFTYNEIGKKGYHNPFYLSFTVESAGNLLSLFDKSLKTLNVGVGGNHEVKGLFGIPYSQFVKFDLDLRKYFQFANGSSLVLRQFIGVGIPYGNSSTMPYMRSYFNGGSSDIRAWLAYGGLGPADTQIDKNVRSFMLDNMKLTTNIEYRFPISDLVEGALFTDAGNIWSLRDTGLGDQFRFDRFYKQLGIGSGFGFRFNIAYVTLRLDFAYKIYDPNQPMGDRWNFNRIRLLEPTINFAFGYPF